MKKMITMGALVFTATAAVSHAAEPSRVLRCEVLRLTTKGVESVAISEIQLGILPEAHDRLRNPSGFWAKAS